MQYHHLSYCLWTSFKVRKIHQISSCGILIHAVAAAHGCVKEESQLGDVVDLGQQVDLEDDLEEVVVHLLVALPLITVGLKFLLTPLLYKTVLICLSVYVSTGRLVYILYQ